MEDAETGEQLYVDTHDKALPAAVPRGRRPSRGHVERRLQAGRRRRGLAVHRRRPRRARSSAWRSFEQKRRRSVARCPSSGRRCCSCSSDDPARGRALPRPRSAGASGRAETYGLPVGSARRPAVARRAGAVLRRRIPAAFLLARADDPGRRVARPQSVIGVPRIEGTVILSFDVSGSMAATDLAPTRMEAAKAAARAFVERQPPSVRDRGRRLQRQRLLGPGADQRPDAQVLGRDRPARPGARHVAGRGI